MLVRNYATIGHEGCSWSGHASPWFIDHVSLSGSTEAVVAVAGPAANFALGISAIRVMP